MKFTWHEEKRQSNIRKHGLDFATGHHVFAGETFTFEDTRFKYGEHRFITIGLLNDMAVIIVHTETTEEIHIISMRRANKHEQELYFENIYG